MAKTKLQTQNDRIKDRAAQNRFIRQEEYRDKVKGSKLLTALGKDFDRLTALQKVVVEAKNSKDKPFQVRTILAKADTEHKIIKTKMDANFKLLNKLLPDLRAIELRDPAGDETDLGSTLAAALRDAVSGTG